MTCIAFDGKTLAGDRLASRGSNTASRVTKIFQRGGRAYAISGTYAYSAAIMAWHIAGADPEKFPKPFDEDDTDACVLVIEPGRPLKVYQSSPAAVMLEDACYAMGSGADFAYGAMAMGADAKTAVEVACNYDAFSGGGVDIIQVMK